MKVAYVTADGCGSGHAVRGIALVQAAQRAGVELRAFGPPVWPTGPLPDLAGYEASLDWRLQVIKWAPDLLLGDLRPDLLDTLRIQAGVPAWLLMRIWLREWRGAPLWDRVISIEPGSADLLGVTHRVPPIVGAQRVWPDDGAEVPAGYNAFHEAAWYGYRDRIRWLDGGDPERAARIRAGGEIAENGADALIAMTLGG